MSKLLKHISIIAYNLILMSFCVYCVNIVGIYAANDASYAIDSDDYDDCL